MAPTRFHSVDEYIASQPEVLRPLLARVRSALRKAVPGAEETISYQIPAYKLDGVAVIYFAGWKEHIALYPASRHVVATLARELASHEVSKGTIRFSLGAPLPLRLIERIAKLRAEEVAPHAKAKTKTKTNARPKTKGAPKSRSAKRRSRKETTR